MYRKDKIRTLALFLGGGLALAVCVGLIAFMAYSLQLRTEYRAACLEINEAILATGPEEAQIGRSGERWPVNQQVLDFYNMRLLDEGTLVFSRRSADTDEQSIFLYLEGGTLSFTGLEDGSAIGIRWETPERTRTYTVRSVTSYMQYTAYLSNYVRRMT